MGLHTRIYGHSKWCHVEFCMNVEVKNSKVLEREEGQLLMHAKRNRLGTGISRWWCLLYFEVA
jgi:hypothetical protein